MGTTGVSILPTKSDGKQMTMLNKTEQFPGQWGVQFNSTNIGGQIVVTASRADLTAAMLADKIAFRTNADEWQARMVFDVNGQGLSLRHSNAHYRDLMDKADIIHADGGFMVTLSRWMGEHQIVERSATTDLIHDFAACSDHEDLRFYLLGGTDEVNGKCAHELSRLYPRLKIVGRRHGYYDDVDEAEIVQEINDARPDVVWVGLGKPKEQEFCVRNRERIRASWLVTCGGCFNYITGDYARAPLWMQRLNLEWVFRMASNPKRFLVRYLTTSPHALYLALAKSKWR